MWESFDLFEIWWTKEQNILKSLTFMCIGTSAYSNYIHTLTWHIFFSFLFLHFIEERKKITKTAFHCYACVLHLQWINNLYSNYYSLFNKMHFILSLKKILFYFQNTENLLTNIYFYKLDAQKYTRKNSSGYKFINIYAFSRVWY